MRNLVVVMTFCLIFFCIGAFGTTYVVCVGIADYPGTRNDLRISDDDAQTISRIFQATKNASVKVLTNHEATQSAVIDAMQTLFRHARATDTMILFFSGHGTPGGLVCHDGPLSYDRIFAVMRDCRAKQKMIFADACYSGKMRTTSSQSSNSYSKQNVMLFLSSRTNETSQETQYKNSLFTIFLERGLRGGADANKDRTITARELYDFVHQGVTKASGNRQHPVMWGKFDNNVPVIKW
ncbi:MAG: caspase family protein [Prevotella sp.]|nr:caspase family protein [Prevotella sp.]